MNHIARIIALMLIGAASANLIESPSQQQEAGDAFQLLVLHNNDMHARFEQTSQLSGVCDPAAREAGKCYGGFPRVATIVRQAREDAATGKGPPVLYLNAGDTYTGTAWFTIYKWQIAVDCLNALRPDAVCLGNHEFDLGLDGLIAFVEHLKSPIVAANLDLSLEPELQKQKNLHRSIAFHIRGRLVGVIGYLTPDTKITNNKNDNVIINDEIDSIRKEVQILRSKGVNIIIALGHSGFEKDVEIAKKVEEVDIVIGGHTNTFLWNGTAPDIESIKGPYPTTVQQESGKLVLVVQAYAYTKYMGKLLVEFDINGDIVSYDGSPILLDNSIEQDKDMLTLLGKYQSVSNSEIIGKTETTLQGDMECRIRECTMGNILTDAMVYEYRKYQRENPNDFPPANIALFNGGSIRTSIDASAKDGNITFLDILMILPFESYLVVLTMSGRELVETFEKAVSRYNKLSGSGAFLQCSGIKVAYNIDNEVRSRVKAVLVKCPHCENNEYTDIDLDAMYNVIVPNYIADGGDGFTNLAQITKRINLIFDEQNSLSLYIHDRSPVTAELENRIIFLGKDDNMLNGSANSIISTYLILVLVLMSNL